MAHWRERIEYKCKKGKIVKRCNISNIYNDVDYYILWDANGNLVDKNISFNVLMKKLQAL